MGRLCIKNATPLSALVMSGITSIVPVNIEPLPRGEQSGEEMFVVGDYEL